jgi:hypothetical protein
MASSIKSGTATVEGLPPGILMHRFSEANENEEETRTIRQDRGTTRERAEQAAYRNEDGTLYAPSTWFFRSIIEVGGYRKQRGSRKSLKYIIPAAIVVTTDTIPLFDLDNKPVRDFEVDARPVVIPSTKGRIMAYRPRIEIWQAEIPMEIDTTILGVDDIHQLLEDAGRKQGVGDFRPEKKGPFGRFQITSWDFK